MTTTWLKSLKIIWKKGTKLNDYSIISSLTGETESQSIAYEKESATTMNSSNNGSDNASNKASNKAWNNASNNASEYDNAQKKTWMVGGRPKGSTDAPAKALEGCV